MLLFGRNIIGSSSEIFGYLLQSSVILGDFRKMFGNDCLAFGQHFENLRKSSERVRKSPENRQKSRHWYVSLLYGSVPQGLGTTKLTNLTGWNGYWPRSRFSHLDRWCFEVKKLQTKTQKIDCFHLTIFISESAKELMRKKSKEDEKTWQNLIRLIAVRKQKVS